MRCSLMREARLRNESYAAPVYVDIQRQIFSVNNVGSPEIQKRERLEGS